MHAPLFPPQRRAGALDLTARPTEPLRRCCGFLLLLLAPVPLAKLNLLPSAAAAAAIEGASEKRLGWQQGSRQHAATARQAGQRAQGPSTHLPPQPRCGGPWSRCSRAWTAQPAHPAAAAAKQSFTPRTMQAARWAARLLEGAHWNGVHNATRCPQAHRTHRAHPPTSSGMSRRRCAQA